MQGCGPKFSGILYFYSFFLLLSLIMLKLFVAVICEAYEEIKNKDYNLNVPLYVEKYDVQSVKESISDILENWDRSSKNFSKSIEEFNKIIGAIIK